MARRFTGNTGNSVNLGDVVAARCPKNGGAWTVLSFIYEDSLASEDDSCIVDKGPTYQMLLRVEKNSDAVQLFQGSEILGGSLGSAVAANTWYLTALICDGSNTTDDMTLYTIRMDGTFLDDGLTGTHNGDSGSSDGDLQIGRLATNADERRGGVFCTSYFTREFTKQDCLNYSRMPYRVCMQYASDCVFFLPLLSDASPEPDWSGNGNAGTVAGTAYTIIANPPIGPLIGLDIGFEGNVAAAAAAAAIDARLRMMMGVGY